MNPSKKKESRDCIRLRAKKFTDIERLLIKEIKKRYNADIAFTKFVPEIPVQKSHTCKHAWSGVIEGSLRSKDPEIKFGDIFCWWGKYVGQLGPFYTTTGSYGRKFSGEFYFFVDDFPHVKEDYVKKSLIEKL